MPIIKVIVQSCHGVFEPKSVFANLVKDCGHESMWTIEARTDERLIEFVENRSVSSHGITYMLGKERHMYITVEKVNTSKPWYISEYDGSESIKYLNYEKLNTKLNYGRLT